MKRFASIFTGLASLAFVFPLSFYPAASEDCADSSYHFVTNGPDGTTVKDMSNARDSYCRVVSDDVRLWQ
jgi:hypothetical protein